ncbi:DNA polymerase III subunit delta [Leyella stercorea]|uniref:DNA polymerase III subunit delta n=1 Tax=Leyella stercorea TaxID=363265 RepID=UPI00266DD75A|nr:DNA polymerase III subunit delta [Leyella stercorea]
MAEKKSSVTFETIMRDLKAKKYAPVYVLMGDESYYIDRITDYIADNVLDPDDRDFNQTVVFGADTTAAQVVDMAKGYPVMPASHRVVIVKEAQGLKSLDALERYFEKPLASTVLVIAYKNGTIDRRKKVVGKAEAVGVVFESKKKRDYELPAFIEAYLKKNHVAIDTKSAAMIAEHIGADLSRLISELDKVMISLPDDDRRVTPDVVEREIGVSKEFNIFELKTAIIERNVFKANQIVKYFDKNPKAGSLFSCLPLLYTYFQNLMVAFYAPDKNNDNNLAAFLELKSVWGLKDYRVGMRNFSAMKTLQILAKIRETDAKSKGLDSLNTSTDDLMRELIFFILH